MVTQEWTCLSGRSADRFRELPRPFGLVLSGKRFNRWNVSLVALGGSIENSEMNRVSCWWHVWITQSSFWVWTKQVETHETEVIFHLPKNSGNSGWDVNGTWVFGSFHWKFCGINRTSEKSVPFSRWKLSNGKFVFHLPRLYCFYHQFHTFCGLRRSAPSNGTYVKWNTLFPNGNSW